MGDFYSNDGSFHHAAPRHALSDKTQQVKNQQNLGGPAARHFPNAKNPSNLYSTTQFYPYLAQKNYQNYQNEHHHILPVAPIPSGTALAPVAAPLAPLAQNSSSHSNSSVAAAPHASSSHANPMCMPYASNSALPHPILAHPFSLALARSHLSNYNQHLSTTSTTFSSTSTGAFAKNCLPATASKLAQVNNFTATACPISVHPHPGGSHPNFTQNHCFTTLPQQANNNSAFNNSSLLHNHSPQNFKKISDPDSLLNEEYKFDYLDSLIEGQKPMDSEVVELLRSDVSHSIIDRDAEVKMILDFSHYLNQRNSVNPKVYNDHKVETLISNESKY